MARCAVCGRRAVHRHHLVKQQRIRKRWKSAKRKHYGRAPWTLTRCLNDRRLLVPVCRLDHEEETPVPLPDGWFDAVREYGLEGDIPRWLGPIYEQERRRRCLDTR